MKRALLLESMINSGELMLTAMDLISIAQLTNRLGFPQKITSNVYEMPWNHKVRGSIPGSAEI